MANKENKYRAKSSSLNSFLLDVLHSSTVGPFTLFFLGGDFFLAKIDNLKLTWFEGLNSERRVR